MDDHEAFLAQRAERIGAYPADKRIQRSARDFLTDSLRSQYSYNFDWMGLPIFQYPQDMLALQEIIWSTRPDCIIETGVARGGSLVFYSSMLELLGGDRFVVGIDIETRPHNRRRIMAHPLSHRIRLVDGSSTDPRTVAATREMIGDRHRIMVCLDSNHSHGHVLRELEIFAPMVAPGCYCVVFDTIIEIMPAGHYSNRPWDKGNNPKTAVDEFLKRLRLEGRTALDGSGLVLEQDRTIERKLILSAALGGYLRRRESVVP